MTNILLVGSGGVGTMAAYALDSHPDTSVTVVVRSDYDTVTGSGYQIELVDYGSVTYTPSRVVPTIEAAAGTAYDYVVVCTKNTPDIYSGADLIEPVVSPKTAIVLIQNGLDIEHEYLAKFPGNIVLSGVSMISSTNYGGRISHEVHDDLLVGAFASTNTPVEEQEKAAHRFVALYKNDRNDCSFDANVRYTRWRKLVYNATLNPICALTDLDVGRLELFGTTDLLVRGAMKEVLQIAAADGVDLPELIMDFMLDLDKGVYYAPLMLVDIRKGNYVEMEVICGSPIAVARAKGVLCPILTVIYALIQAVQKKTMEKKGALVVPRDRPIVQRN